MAGEGVVGLAVDEEADLGDLGKCGVEGADDRLQGEGFDLNAGGVVVDEGAAEVDDGQLFSLRRGSFGRLVEGLSGVLVGSLRRKTSSTAGPLWSGWAEVGRA